MLALVHMMLDAGQACIPTDCIATPMLQYAARGVTNFMLCAYTAQHSSVDCTFIYLFYINISCYLSFDCLDIYLIMTSLPPLASR